MNMSNTVSARERINQNVYRY